MVSQPDGSKKRIQVFHKTQDAARRALAKEKEKREKHGAAVYWLTDSDRMRFCEARDKLASVGATISDAVAHFLGTHKPPLNSIALPALFERLIEEKRRLGAAPRYLATLKVSCMSFIRGRKEVLASEVTREHVQEWVHGQGWAPKTQRVYLGDLRTMFSFAVASGFARENPCGQVGENKIALSRMVAAPIQTFSADHAAALLDRAARVPTGDEEDFRPLLSYAAIGLFCGIRPAEMARIDRAAISRSERHVVIEANQSKTRRRRVVDLTHNCTDWLALDPVGKGLLVSDNFRRRWLRLREAAGVPWSHDVMRHTFASMHYAQHQNESLLKAQMGHSAGEDVLFRHYRALKTRAEASAFWALVPGGRVGRPA